MELDPYIEHSTVNYYAMNTVLCIHSLYSICRVQKWFSTSFVGFVGFKGPRTLRPKKSKRFVRECSAHVGGEKTPKNAMLKATNPTSGTIRERERERDYTTTIQGVCNL